MPEPSATIDPDLLAILVCPIDHASLELRETALVCPVCERSFPIVDGIPNMTVDQ